MSNVFKMRLEIITDVSDFLCVFFRETCREESIIQIEKTKYCGGTLTITTNQSKEFIKKIIDSCEDLHVMSQTLESIEEYTGNRL